MIRQATFYMFDQIINYDFNEIVYKQFFSKNINLNYFQMGQKLGVRKSLNKEV